MNFTSTFKVPHLICMFICFVISTGGRVRRTQRSTIPSWFSSHFFAVRWWFEEIILRRYTARYDSFFMIHLTLAQVGWLRFIRKFTYSNKILKCFTYWTVLQYCLCPYKTTCTLSLFHNGRDRVRKRCGIQNEVINTVIDNS